MIPVRTSQKGAGARVDEVEVEGVRAASSPLASRGMVGVWGTSTRVGGASARALRVMSALCSALASVCLPLQWGGPPPGAPPLGVPRVAVACRVAEVATLMA